MKFTKGNRKKKSNVRKVAESWSFGSVTAYKEAQKSGQLHRWILEDIARR